MRWFSALLVLSLSACTSWRDIPDDVKLIALHYEAGPYETNSRGEVVDIEIETNFNYLNYPESAAGVTVEFFFCNQKNIYVEGLGGLDLFRHLDKWTPVDRGVHDDSPPPYRYHTAIHVAAHEAKPSIPGRQSVLNYDLRKDPQDLCFYVDIGAYSHEKSNIVRIPKEELIKFFAEHPRPQTGSTQ